MNKLNKLFLKEKKYIFYILFLYSKKNIIKIYINIISKEIKNNIYLFYILKIKNNK